MHPLVGQASNPIPEISLSLPVSQALIALPTGAFGPGLRHAGGAPAAASTLGLRGSPVPGVVQSVSSSPCHPTPPLPPRESLG